MNIRDTNEFKAGRIVERCVQRWLESQGYWVIPVSLIEDDGHAPTISRQVERHVLPDLRVEGQGRWAGWCEVKYKKEAVWYNIAQQYRHGFGTRLWNNYQEVEQITGVPGNLVFVQRYPLQLLLIAPISEVTPIPGVGNMRDFGENMTFFRVEEFEHYEITLDADLPEIERKVSYPWDGQRPWPKPWPKKTAWEKAELEPVTKTRSRQMELF
jgi:hypothetical protein